MKNKAFSLLELMVVITIVGVLTAIAIPVYKNYTLRANMSQVLTVFDSYAQQSKLYYEKHGVFPTNAQVGVPAGFPANAAGYLVKPYVSFMSFMGDGVTSGCHFTVLISYISNYGEGGDLFTNSNATVSEVRYYLIDVGGTIVAKCQAMEYVNATPTGINHFPICDIDPFEFNTSAIVDPICQ